MCLEWTKEQGEGQTSFFFDFYHKSKRDGACAHAMHGKFTYFWASQQARFRIYLASLCREEAHRNLCWTKP